MKRAWLSALEQDGTQTLLFQCPGCEYAHGIPVAGPRRWAWDGSTERPTVQPSILVHRSAAVKRCHSFVEDGRIRFLEDCDHALAGKVVELPPIEGDREPVWPPDVSGVLD